MINKRDAEVFIVCLSCHFDVGLFHVIEQEVPCWQFLMIHVCLQWLELAWDLSRVAWGLGIRTSRDMRFSTFDLLSICFIIVLALTLTIQDAYDGGNEISKLVSIIIFWRFIKLAIFASLCEGSFFYFYVESPPSTFMHCLREHSCHSEFNMHSPKVYHWLIHDYGFACS
jgi:hypothetical protein